VELVADQTPSECWAKLNSLSKRARNIEILNQVVSVGRLPDNDIQILDKRLSGKHCKIMRKVDGEGRMIIVLEDSSSNGTYLNGQNVSLIQCFPFFF
jgi:pSer/pThr/pTyr-binding forkhead associated (FHA) protein